MQLRMQQTAHRLCQGPGKLAEVAGEIDQNSAAAFLRAYKRHFAQPPEEWRQESTSL